ncbi:MAG: hypothetical protein U5K55_02665 [Aliarcobacter sp.]|nr:hypothetical protein [Aliarcobacter sp.]
MLIITMLYLNPTWGPSLAFIETFTNTIAYSGMLLLCMWTWIIATFSKNEEDKEAKGRIVKFLAGIMMITVPLSAIFGYWYYTEIPAAALAMIPTAVMTRAFEDRFDLMYANVI